VDSIYIGEGMKYSVGDRVLVEAEITEDDDSDTKLYKVKVASVDFYVNETRIYSKLDHDFKPGERVEVSDDDDDDDAPWEISSFVGVSSSDLSFPWVAEGLNGACNYTFIRKLQPESHDGKTALIDGKEYDLILKTKE
jgi:hypothetical protein